jgi:hypothetical protein
MNVAVRAARNTGTVCRVAARRKRKHYHSLSPGDIASLPSVQSRPVTMTRMTLARVDMFQSIPQLSDRLDRGMTTCSELR